MAGVIDRRQFLSGNQPAFRPPWALPEAQFVEKCTRCDDCIVACPDQLIFRGRGGFPQIDFKRGGCDFCQECVSSCKPAALRAAPVALPWSIQASILPACLAMNAVICRACGEACDDSAIRFKPELGGVARPQLDPESCSGCGACITVCPVGAVAMTAQPQQRKSA